MSEEILKALTQLFAIITKQDDGVTEVERRFVELFFKQRLSKDVVEEYLALYEEFLVEKKKKRRKVDPEKEAKPEKDKKLTSMKDSVRTLAICKKINKTLAQKQKVIVLIELLELVNSDKNFSPQRREIINTVAEVFNIQSDEYSVIEKFVLEDENAADLDYDTILVAADTQPEGREKQHFAQSKGLDGKLLFIRIASVDMYFVKYLGHDEILLNSSLLPERRVYLFSGGSTIKPAKDAPLYYSDLVGHFQKDSKIPNVTFNCKHLEFKFPNGYVGLHDVNISEDRGRLIGIMGASGAGKTTLLNVLAGIETPSKGEVLINGLNIHTQKDQVQGVIGYITQDDILIEDLTVFENLYFNAKLCFKDYSEEEIIEAVETTLENLGLLHIRDIQVGSVLNKKISGGQRKRLNIALELIREPAVMFVDEPTSGLSSRDSENVIGLLKELSLKGKLIFVVIHQPSSDIYKMFDKMFIMDTGGYPIYYGHPVEAIIHFRKATNQINSEKGQCSECGSVNPEQLFDTVEAQVVNEYGQLTNKRKVTPLEWSGLYKETFSVEHVKDKEEAPPNSLKIPTRVRQWFIYTKRDLKSKLGNTQYLLINLLEAPFLALLLSWLIRYTNSTDGTSYLFRYNENLPAYILMSIVVALFMGLTVSAEEIIRDRKIQKREALLNLSRSSYLFSKIGILFTLSAVQTLVFVLIGNMVLGIDGMYIQYWLMLFTISCFANILGLNISASFNSAVTVYIVIPLLLIPQMVLSGALFSFDKLNDTISSKEKVPLVADIMASRWAYEGIAVEQFKNNNYQKYFFENDKLKSDLNYRKSYLIPKLREIINELKSGSLDEETANQKLLILNVETEKIATLLKSVKKPEGLDFSVYTDELGKNLNLYLDLVNDRFIELYNKVVAEIDKTTLKLDSYYSADSSSNYSLETLKDESFNETLDELMRNIATKNRVLEYKGEILQQIDPVYKSHAPSNMLDYRAHFYASEKHFAGSYMSTYWFNLLVIWGMSLFLYFTLYFEAFKRVFEKIGSMFSKNEF